MTIPLHLKVPKICIRASVQKEIDLYYREHKLPGMHGCYYEPTNIREQVYQVLNRLPCSQAHVQKIL